jgi:predicted AAA+ superfamily ATPase
MLARHLGPRLAEALADTPAVMLVGPRQAGKTTLAKAVAAQRERSTYVTLDDATAVDAAVVDPTGFVAGLRTAASGPIVVDEVQKAPRLLPAIKAAIDAERRPGSFLLTGSADVLALPQVSESLAGRMEVLTLWPLSQGELERRRDCFVDAVLHGERPEARRQTGDDAITRVLRGGYPEAVARPRPDRRRAFFESYVTTLVARDVRDLADIDQPAALRRLLQLVATRTSSVLNHAELSRVLGLPASTLKRYLALLEHLFLVDEVPAWASNRGKRLVRAAKLHVVDSGLAAALVGADDELLRTERTLLGSLLESFVAAELRKQIGWSELGPTLHHFRTHGGQEVDLVLEDRRGRVVESR